jgi:hypothetical protein
MTKLVTYIAAAVVLMICVAPAQAQVDQMGSLDTVFADLAKISPTCWSVTISVTNDEALVGLSIPLEFTGGPGIRLVGDSAVYTGGRAEQFAYKGFRADTAIQAVTLGMIANVGPTKNDLFAGRGRLVTIFVSSMDDQEIKQLKVDTTTTHPANSLLLVANRIQPGNPPDTLEGEERKKQEIIPAFIVRDAN